MISYEKKVVLKHYYLILFLLKIIFLLLHAEFGVGDKIVYTYFDWINERIKPITDDELALTNSLIDLKIKLKKNI